MLTEALEFWNTISGKVKRLVKDETQNAFRCERYTVTTAPNGTRIGVTLPMGTNEIFLPYSQELSTATVGASVLVVWWGSMSNAKVYYYADGYNGSIGANPLDSYPVGALYISTESTSPASLFGGTWEQIKDKFILSAGDTYTAGDTGGAATHAHTTGGHTLTVTEIPSHTHLADASNTNVGWLRSAGAISRRTVASGSGATNQYYGAEAISRTTGTYTGGGGSHSHGNTGSASNMPPYLAVYVWRRTA